MTTQTLLKLLTEAGIGSRRRVAEAIINKHVKVNGKIVEDLRYPINTETDFILIDEKPVEITPKKTVTLMLHKPEGFISTASDEKGRKTVLDILPEKYRRLRLYPAGRLDRDSTGLILLTNDGELTYRLTHPRYEFEKEYLIYIEGQLRKDEKQKLERGIRLEDGITRPAIVREAKFSPPFNYSITIHEGKKRQVRRMLEKVGHRVLALKRIRMGNLKLGNLKEGKTRELSQQEVRFLVNQS